METEGVVRVAVNLDRHTIYDFDLDAAAGVAVEADGIQGVFCFQQLVGLGLGQFAGLNPGNEITGKIKMGGNDGAATGQGLGFKEIAARYGVFCLICHRAPPAFQ
jgi:hypothetical protein